MQQKIVIDTNVYIDMFNHGRHSTLNQPPRYITYLAYPVLHELWMGARGNRERKHLDSLQNRFVALRRLIVPTDSSIVTIGKLCLRLRRSGRLDPVHPRHYNDLTIAVLARQVGATVLTHNSADFTAIRDFFDFQFDTP